MIIVNKKYRLNYLETIINKKKEELYMGLLSWIGGIVVLFWLLGLVFQIGGGLIHTLLVVAAIVFIFDFITKKKV